MHRPRLNIVLPALVAATLAAGATAAPYRPASPTQVLETLPLKRSDPAAARQQALTAAWRAHPDDPAAAVALAEHYFARTAAEGDPRYVGHAQAVLAPWWSQPAPPPAVRRMRAVLQQFNHAFDAAAADLRAVVEATPDDAEAWAWLAAIATVQARYDDARAACGRLLVLAPAGTPGWLGAVGCAAQVDSLTGRAADAAQSLRAALQRDTSAAPELRLWALTRLGEIEERRGDDTAAEAAFQQALALGIEDNYLQCAWADHLLDRGQPAQVLALLKDKGRADTLLLRLALAAKAARDPSLAVHERDLAARFDAARRRGDTTHEKEESRFALQVQGDVPRALALAQRNFAVQREPADARALLEAAVAAKDGAAAAPVLQWLDAHHVESVALRALAQRLGTTR